MTMMAVRDSFHYAPMETSAQPGDIIVNGEPAPPPAPDGNGGDGGSTPIGAGGNTGSGSNGSNGYETPGASNAANQFADHTLYQSKTDPAYTKAYAKYHDTLAKFFDKFQAHPGNTIDIGGGHYVSFATIYHDLQKTTIDLTDQSNLQNSSSGADTYYVPNSNPVIVINPDNANQTNWDNGQGDAGYNFVLLHEIGHVATFYNSGGDTADYRNESYANAAAVSIGNAIQVPVYSGPIQDGYTY